MPRRADLGIESYDAGYDSLAELETASPYTADARALSAPCPAVSSGPRVLVCHDNDGLPPATTAERRYTFEHWQSVTDFVHFSHRRVTIPPPDQIVSAHRNGARCLGTLIFEGEAGARDCVDLVASSSKTGSSLLRLRSGPRGSPFDRVDLHFVDKLVELALAKGLDGWLMNVEVALGLRDGTRDEKGRPIRRFAREHAAALVAWTEALRSEVSRRIPSGTVIWYDSVTTLGDLRWQCRLTPVNAPFFLAADAIFLDYHWQAEWLQDLPALADMLNKSGKRALLDKKAVKHGAPDVFVGIDVYGRGMLGGGGFDTHVALAAIPKSLSIALFAPAWTRDELSKPRGEPFSTWEADDAYFWRNGSRVPDSVERERARGDAEDERRRRDEGDEPYSRPAPPFRPVADLLPIKRLSESDRFFTCFARGGGDEAFRIEGEEAIAGPWTDVGVMTPAADRVKPNTKGVKLTETNSWLAGHALQLDVDMLEERSLLLCSINIAFSSARRLRATVTLRSLSEPPLLLELTASNGSTTLRACAAQDARPERSRDADSGVNSLRWRTLTYDVETTTERITAVGIQLHASAKGEVVLGSIALAPADAPPMRFGRQPVATRAESGQTEVAWRTSEAPVWSAIEVDGEAVLGTTLHPARFIIPADVSVKRVRVKAVGWNGLVELSKWVVVSQLVR